MFNGNKLKYTRLAHGYSRKELAEKLGITEQAIGQYENGQIQPKFDTLVRLNDTFGVASKFFFSEIGYQKEELENKIAFRNSDREQRSKVEFENHYLNDVHYYLSIFAEKINLFLPNLMTLKNSLLQDFSEYTEREIESIALKVRQNLNITDNRHLLPILEQNGIIVLEKGFASGKTDACSVWIKEVPYIILGNQQKSFVRRNFDLAHELGHLLLHAKREINNLDKKEFDQLEKEANLFASYFLLPTNEFLSDLRDIKKNISNPDAYIELKKKWKVSISALAYRAHKSGEMSYQQYRYFNISLNKKGYKIVEPLDLEFTIVRPQRLKKMFEFVFESGVIKLNTFLDSSELRIKALVSKFQVDEEVFKKYLESTTSVLNFEFSNNRGED